MRTSSGSVNGRVAGRVGSVWYEGATRRERLGDALRRNRLDVLLALTPENAAYLSGRTSVIATLWRLPGLVAVAVNDRGEMAVAAGDNETGGYEGVVARFAHPLWIEHLDLRLPGANLEARVDTARPEGALPRPAQFDAELMLDAVAAAVGAVAAMGRRIGAELAMLPGWVAEGLRQRLPNLEWVEAGAIFDDLRAIKDADEIAHLRLAAELTEIGIAGARDALRPGLSAIGVSAAYQRAIWERAASDDRFAALRQVEGLVSVGDGSRAGRGRTGADGQTRHAGRRRRLPQRRRSYLRPGSHRRATGGLRCLARCARRGGRRARAGRADAGCVGGRVRSACGSGIRQLQPGTSRPQRRTGPQLRGAALHRRG